MMMMMMIFHGARAPIVPGPLITLVGINKPPEIILIDFL
jgi:hypothetical protein